MYPQNYSECLKLRVWIQSMSKRVVLSRLFYNLVDANVRTATIQMVIDLFPDVRIDVWRKNDHSLPEMVDILEYYQHTRGSLRVPRRKSLRIQIWACTGNTRYSIWPQVNWMGEAYSFSSKRPKSDFLRRFPLETREEPLVCREMSRHQVKYDRLCGNHHLTHADEDME